MADAEDSKSSVGNHVRVQVPPSAPTIPPTTPLRPATDEARAVDHSTGISAAWGTPVLGNRNKKGSTAISITAISQKQSL